jgi:hypothetical protein
MGERLVSNWSMRLRVGISAVNFNFLQGDGLRPER